MSRGKGNNNTLRTGVGNWEWVIQNWGPGKGMNWLRPQWGGVMGSVRGKSSPTMPLLPPIGNTTVTMSGMGNNSTVSSSWGRTGKVIRSMGIHTTGPLHHQWGKWGRHTMALSTTGKNNPGIGITIRMGLHTQVEQQLAVGEYKGMGQQHRRTRKPPICPCLWPRAMFGPRQPPPTPRPGQQGKAGGRYNVGGRVWLLWLGTALPSITNNHLPVRCLGLPSASSLLSWEACPRHATTQAISTHLLGWEE